MGASEVIKTSDFSRKLPFVRDAPVNELSRHQRRRLEQLAVEFRRRGYAPICSRIKGFLDHDQDSGYQSFANNFQQTMAAEVADAIGKGKDLRLAYLSGDSRVLR